MEQQEILKRFKVNLESRRYAPNTVSGYLHCIKTFYKAFKDRDLYSLSESELIHFVNQIKSDKRFKPSYKKHIIRAVEAFYLLVYDVEYNFDKRHLAELKKHFAHTLHIDKLGIRKMIECASNPKHQCVIGLLYSAGLRVQELIALRNSNIDIGHQRLQVLNPSTKSIRSMHLSVLLIPYLKRYRRSYSGNQKIFQGYKDGDFTPRAVQQIVARAACTAEIGEKVTPSMLRNNFAIHLLQSGTRPDLVKDLLGLESDQSMQKFIMAANRVGVSMKSPLE